MRLAGIITNALIRCFGKNNPVVFAVVSAVVSIVSWKAYKGLIKIL